MSRDGQRRTGRWPGCLTVTGGPGTGRLADGPDEQVAAELDAAAQRADRRGQPRRRLRRLRTSRRAVCGPAAKGRRLALAAEAATDAGQLPGAADLARQAGQLVTDPAAAVVLARVRAQLEFEAGWPTDSVGILLEWAALLGLADPGAAEAVLAGAVHILWLAVGPAHPELERRAAAMTPPVGARLVEFLQAVRRLQDGDTDVRAHRSGHAGPRLASVLGRVLPAVL